MTLKSKFSKICLEKFEFVVWNYLKKSKFWEICLEKSFFYPYPDFKPDWRQLACIHYIDIGVHYLLSLLHYGMWQVGVSALSCIWAHSGRPYSLKAGHALFTFNHIIVELPLDWVNKYLVNLYALINFLGLFVDDNSRHSLLRNATGTSFTCRGTFSWPWLERLEKSPKYCELFKICILQ